MYPPFPVPIQDVAMESSFDDKKLRAAAGKFINNNSIDITSGNHKTFVTEDIATPKVLLFTNSKKGTPFIFKALSSQFEKTLQFGLIRDSEDGLVKQYKVKKFPALFVVKDGKPIRFEEKEFSYNKIFEFINVYSQIFVDPTQKENQSEPKKSAAAKPWLIANVPLLTEDSGNDICLMKDGTLCVIMVVKDQSSVDQNALSEMNALGEAFESKISRGITFKFMQLDASTEPEFAKVFDLPEYPRVVVMNPGKRKRFIVHDGPISGDGIEKTLNKILGGDARFKAIKGNKLPALVSKYPGQEEKQ